MLTQSRENSFLADENQILDTSNFNNAKRNAIENYTAELQGLQFDRLIQACTDEELRVKANEARIKKDEIIAQLEQEYKLRSQKRTADFQFKSEKEDQTTNSNKVFKKTPQTPVLFPSSKLTPSPSVIVQDLNSDSSPTLEGDTLNFLI